MAKKRKDRQAPKAARNDTDLGQFLNSLEVPACNCKQKNCQQPDDCPGEANCRYCPQAMCRHVLEAEHSLSLEEWSAFLLDYDSNGYGELPDPKTGQVICIGRDKKAFHVGPSCLPTQRMRIAMYSLRCRARLALFPPPPPGSPMDRLSGDTFAGDVDVLAVQAGKGRIELEITEGERTHRRKGKDGEM